MSTFLLVPGAGGSARYWHRVAPVLREAGHAAIAVDLPGADPDAGLPEYRDLVVGAGAGHDDVVLVAQSMGGFAAVAACRHLPTTQLVLLNAMVPAPRETPDDWWRATGWEAAHAGAARDGGYPATLDLETAVLHDVPPDVAATIAGQDRPEAAIAFAQPCDLLCWPAVPTTVLAGREDRLLPLAFQQRVARRRLGLEPVVVPGGHLAALSRPTEVAAALLAAERTGRLVGAGGGSRSADDGAPRRGTGRGAGGPGPGNAASWSPVA